MKRWHRAGKTGSRSGGERRSSGAGGRGRYQQLLPLAPGARYQPLPHARTQVVYGGVGPGVAHQEALQVDARLASGGGRLVAVHNVGGQVGNVVARVALAWREGDSAKTVRRVGARTPLVAALRTSHWGRASRD